MSKFSKRRNRLGAFLAVLSLTTTAKNNFASAIQPYSSQSRDLAISDIEWESILDSYDEVAKCKLVTSSLSNDFLNLRKNINTLRNYAESFMDCLSKSYMKRPSVWDRFFGGNKVDLANSSIEEKTNSACIALNGFCNAIGSGNKDAGFVPSLEAFMNNVSKTFPSIYSMEQIKTEYDNLNLNFIDLLSQFNGIPEKVAENKDSASDIGRYDRYDRILSTFEEKCRSLVEDAISKLDRIENIASQFVKEAGSLVSRVEARNSEKERKQKEEQERIEREAQEKLEKEKKAAEEQKQKEMEEARKNKEEAERKFFAEKSKWQNEFAEILERTDNEFEAMCKNSDSDVGELIRKNQGNYVAEFKSSVEAEIEILNDLKEYDEINLQKVIDMRTKSLDIKEQKRKLEKSVKDYKNDLIREKKELESLKNEITIDINKVKSDLDLTWQEEIGKLIPQDDKERFTNMASASYETAKKIADQMVQEVGQVKIDLTRNSRSDIENLKSRIQDRRNKVLRSIDTIKNKGLSIRIVGMKDSINKAFRERDRLWTEFKNKYEPSRLTDSLRAKTSNIWASISALYGEELSYSKSIEGTLKSKDVNDDVAERLDAIITDLSGRLGTWRNNLRDHEANMQEFLDQIRVTEGRKLAFKRIFSTEGAFDLVKNDVGESSANATAADSDKIADVIDSFLPGTHDVIRAYADAARVGGYQCILTSGHPGWGKTQGVKYFASAINAKIIEVDYDKLQQGDGAKYAESLFQSANGNAQPWILLMDEFDNVSGKGEPGKPRPKSAAVLNNFLNKVKQLMEDSSTNLKLVACLSNENKDKLDEANFSRMTKYMVLGNNPDYKRIVNIICSGVRCATDEVSKEDFVNKIARHCESLMLKGREVSARTINQSILAVARAWCDNINKDKSKGDPDYIELYDAQISSNEICEKLSNMSGGI